MDTVRYSRKHVDAVQDVGVQELRQEGESARRDAYRVWRFKAGPLLFHNAHIQAGEFRVSKTGCGFCKEGLGGVMGLTEETVAGVESTVVSGDRADKEGATPSASSVFGLLGGDEGDGGL